MITVSLSLALLFGIPGCEDGCRVLVGKETPKGTFRAVPMSYQAYGFQETNDGIFAIHPTWNEERYQKLNSMSRREVTNGCINVDLELFKKLPRASFKLVIVE